MERSAHPAFHVEGLVGRGINVYSSAPGTGVTALLTDAEDVAAIHVESPHLVRAVGTGRCDHQ